MPDSSVDGNVCKHGGGGGGNHIMLLQVAGEQESRMQEQPGARQATIAMASLPFLSQLTAGKERLKLFFSTFLHGQI